SIGPQNRLLAKLLADVGLRKGQSRELVFRKAIARENRRARGDAKKLDFVELLGLAVEINPVHGRAEQTQRRRHDQSCFRAAHSLADPRQNPTPPFNQAYSLWTKMIQRPGPLAARHGKA